jgi:hypothetical protein
MKEKAPPPSSPPTTGAARGSSRWRASGEALAVSAVAIVVVGAGIFGLWVTSTSTIRDNYHQYLIGLAQTAASMIDPALQTTIRRPDQINGPEYQRAVAPLRRMRASVADVHYIYTVVQDHSKVHFVLDASVPGANANGVEDQSGVWEIYKERDPAMELALGKDTKAGIAAATDEPYSDKWGTFMTGWAPIFDMAGGQIGAVGVDVDAHVYAARVAAAPTWALLGLSPACIAAGQADRAAEPRPVHGAFAEGRGSRTRRRAGGLCRNIPRFRSIQVHQRQLGTLGRRRTVAANRRAFTQRRAHDGLDGQRSSWQFGRSFWGR